MENKWAMIDTDDDDAVNEDNPGYLALIAQPRGSTPTKPQSNDSEEVTQSHSAQHQPRPQQKAFQESQHQNVFRNQQTLDGSDLGGYFGLFPVQNPRGDMQQRGSMLSKGHFKNQNNCNHQWSQNNMNSPRILHPEARYPQQQQQQQREGGGHTRQSSPQNHQQLQQMSLRQQFSRDQESERPGQFQYDQSESLGGYTRANPRKRVLKNFLVIDGNEASEETVSMCAYNPMHVYKSSDIRIHESMCPNRPLNQQKK